MTFKILIAAGGLLVFVMVGMALWLGRRRSGPSTSDQLSGDWLAQARGREEQQW